MTKIESAYLYNLTFFVKLSAIVLSGLAYILTEIRQGTDVFSKKNINS